MKGKSSGRPRSPEENVRRFQKVFAQSLRNSIRRARRELQIPHQTIRKALRKQHFPYSLVRDPFLQAEPHCPIAVVLPQTDKAALRSLWGRGDSGIRPSNATHRCLSSHSIRREESQSEAISLSIRASLDLVPEVRLGIPGRR
ncbi:hypothetical protein AVEN_108626-1 [Araneus ventricosus]|uniref:Uncharacterized protein n=1 Tax=Araneus ventricosus TaxID=182803 RepID=A0A4Y2DIK8_ARAVE|nr:hypothetical protein AVEN_108626-1 [Araneus ventricosus]